MDTCNQMYQIGAQWNLRITVTLGTKINGPNIGVAVFLNHIMPKSSRTGLKSGRNTGVTAIPRWPLSGVLLYLNKTVKHSGVKVFPIV